MNINMNMNMNTNKQLTNILNDYVCLRCDIENNHSGKMKLGCVAFSDTHKHQCVLRVWS